VPKSFAFGVYNTFAMSAAAVAVHPSRSSRGRRLRRCDPTTAAADGGATCHLRPPPGPCLALANGCPVIQPHCVLNIKHTRNPNLYTAAFQSQFCCRAERTISIFSVQTWYTRYIRYKPQEIAKIRLVFTGYTPCI
jgi:hypothetical protein